MSGRRSRSRGRSRGNRPRDCYREVSGGLDDRPAFDTTPFDSSKGGSVWKTLSTESIFDPKDRSTVRSLGGSPPGGTCQDWYSSLERDDPSSSPRATGSGYSGTERRTSHLKAGLERSKPSNPGMPSSPPTSRPSSYSCQDAKELGSYTSSAGPSCDDEDDDDDFFSNLLSSEYIPRKIVVDTTPLPPWKPYYASERLEDPNNPPPMFHPMFANEWRYDPNISEDLRAFYNSTCSEFSPNFCIFDYGRLSEFNTLNLYAPEKFDIDRSGSSPGSATVPADCGAEDCRMVDFDDRLDSVPPACAPIDAATDFGDPEERICTVDSNDQSASCSVLPKPPPNVEAEVFGDPYEALARPIDDVPEKFRKEKWHYFEVKKRLELFKKLGMESDLAMYEGQLERMEADPWTGDSSGRGVEVYVRGYEGDPALDDSLLEGMEALVDPSNEGRKAFWAAMENPPPIRDPEDCDEFRELEQLVAPTNVQRMEFMAALGNPPPSRQDSDSCGLLNTTFTLSKDDSDETPSDDC